MKMSARAAMTVRGCPLTLRFFTGMPAGTGALRIGAAGLIAKEPGAGGGGGGAGTPPKAALDGPIGGGGGGAAGDPAAGGGAKMP